MGTARRETAHSRAGNNLAGGPPLKRIKVENAIMSPPGNESVISITHTNGPAHVRRARVLPNCRIRYHSPPKRRQYPPASFLKCWAHAAWPDHADGALNSKDSFTDMMAAELIAVFKSSAGAA